MGQLLKMKKGRTLITVQVQPGANRNQITRYIDGILHIRIAAPPVRGKANRELIEFLSDILSVSRSSISIEKGRTNRRKVIAVEGMGEGEVVRGGLTPL